MKRTYTSVANFRAPYNNVEFAGIGADAPPSWPKGRSYHSTANFMATQDEGYFQNNSLFGLGATAARPQLLSSQPVSAAAQELARQKHAAKLAEENLRAQAAANAAMQQQIAAKSSSNTFLISAVAVLALAASGGVYWYVRKGKQGV